MPLEPVPFEALSTADLIVDRVYRGGTRGNTSDDPLNRLLPGIGNQGGFRYSGSVLQGTVRAVVLYSSGTDPDWPDGLDPATGDFTYYGDNKSPGRELHDTQRRGNELLRQMFQKAHTSPVQREQVPPIFLFERAATSGRDVIFRGLAAPGSSRLASDEELVAVWRTKDQRRFQNYRAHFTVLDVPVVSREWLGQVLNGNVMGTACPRPWRSWIRGRVYEALEAPRTISTRSRGDQYPTAAKMPILQAVYDHFAPHPTLFEHLAAMLWERSDPNVMPVDVTRPSRDGGRDGLGFYLVGPRQDPVKIEFAMEAKCFRPESNSVGVREMSRLISRIKHRDFGVMVTTSHVAEQAYKEVREDQHPIVILAGREVVDLLGSMGYSTVDEVRQFLEQEFPISVTTTPDVVYPSEELLEAIEVVDSAEERLLP
ncbi:restriction endonuclease [Aestuariimicrobium sp. Y1814]|uniref:restriction endonuclease n=1 Tax=Aestuariimicrobium sp. Y1814 TaxID=3418742 RepID=UPI003DA6F46F